MERQELTNPNVIQVFIQTEKGCNPLEGEYSLSIGSSKYPLDISSPGGVDDVSLVKDAIENEFDLSSLPEEGLTEVVLIESGEWEDVFWNKYYLVHRYDTHYGS
jgi:hypothetical protein